MTMDMNHYRVEILDSDGGLCATGIHVDLTNVPESERHAKFLGEVVKEMVRYAMNEALD